MEQYMAEFNWCTNSRFYTAFFSVYKCFLFFFNSLDFIEPWIPKDSISCTFFFLGPLFSFLYFLVWSPLFSLVLFSLHCVVYLYSCTHPKILRATKQGPISGTAVRAFSFVFGPVLFLIVYHTRKKNLTKKEVDPKQREKKNYGISIHLLFSPFGQTKKKYFIRIRGVNLDN